jgi:hypothetical protein
MSGSVADDQALGKNITNSENNPAFLQCFFYMNHKNASLDSHKTHSMLMPPSNKNMPEAVTLFRKKEKNT